MREVISARNSLLLIAVTLFLASTVALAQSTDLNRPTPLVSGDIRGVGDDNQRQYYHSFTAGPGEVVVVLDVEGGPIVNVDILDASFRKLLNVWANSGQKIDRVNVMRAQPLTVQVTVPRGAGNYRVRLTGAAKFADSAAPVAPAAAAPSGPVESPADRFNLSLPGRGILRIEMKDGSVREIDARQIKQISVQ